MTVPQYTQDNLRITLTSPLGPNQLLFKSLQGEEALSTPFRFTIETFSQSDELDFKKIVGQNLGITVQFTEDNQRYFNGMVTRFVQAGQDARFTLYHAEIRPWLWALTLTKNCRIFQKLSAPEIIKKIFDESGFSDYRLRLIYSYDKREYCVQYEESAFNFVCRLMEDEGIFYFFEHYEDKHVLVLADDLGVHQDCPGIDTVRLWQSSNETEPEDVITQCQFTQQMVTGRYAVGDFDFEIPTVHLHQEVGGPCSDYRVYEYAAGFKKSDQGTYKVRRRIETQEWGYQLLEGQGHCFSFTSGYQFQLTEHPRKQFNQSYLLRWVSHNLSFNHYSNAFQALPADIPFRTPTITPKPRIVSTQTAIVTGPKNESMWTDQYGRIKVQFHWDQQGQYDENSSCWIRVNQGWAGKGWGSLFIPRIGQEVIVSFLEGNPDKPIVTGAVYNAQQRVPYSLPANQTKSTIKSRSLGEEASMASFLLERLAPIATNVAALITKRTVNLGDIAKATSTIEAIKNFVSDLRSQEAGNSNEIRLDDQPGKEQVYIHAQKNAAVCVENDLSTSVGAGETHTIVGGRNKVVGGSESNIIVGNDDKIVGGNKENTIYGNFKSVLEGVNFSPLNSGISAFQDPESASKQLSFGHDVATAFDGVGDYELILKEGNSTTTLKKGDDKLILEGKKQVIKPFESKKVTEALMPVAKKPIELGKNAE